MMRIANHYGRKNERDPNASRCKPALPGDMSRLGRITRGDRVQKRVAFWIIREDTMCSLGKIISKYHINRRISFKSIFLSGLRNGMVN